MVLLGIIGVVVFFVLGNVFLYHDRIAWGVVMACFSVASLAMAALDWAGVRRRLASLKTPAPQAGLVPSTGAGSASGLPQEMAAPSQGWNLPSEIRLSSRLVLGTAVGLIALGQILWFAAGSALAGTACSALGVLAFVAYWRTPEQDLAIPVVEGAPWLVLLVGIGLATEAMGAVAYYRERFYLGFGLTALATAILVQALSRFLDKPLRARLGSQPEFLLEPFHYPYPSGLRALAWKGGCLLVFLFLWMLAGRVSDYVNSVLSLAAGTAFLFAAFPLFPSGIERLESSRPGLAKFLSWLLVALALDLAIKGQAQLTAGAVVPGFWMFLGAAVAFILAFPAKETESEKSPPSRRELMLVGLLMLVAFAIRVYRVGSVPYGVEGDEAGAAQWSGWANSMQIDNIFMHTAQVLYWYWSNTPFLKLLGIVPAAVRAHSVLHGTLSVFTFYLLLRLFFEWRAALVGAFLLCFSTWSLHFSRFGHFNIEQVFAESIGFYFILKAFRTGRISQGLIGGITLAMAVMGHVAGRLLVPSVGLFLVYYAAFHGRSARRLALVVACGMLGGWLMLSPMAIRYYKNPTMGFARIREVSVFNHENSNAPADRWSGIVQNLKISMLMFNKDGDTRLRDNWLTPGPMMDPVCGVLFVLGLGFALYWWKKPLYGFFLILFFGTLAASVMSVEAPQSLRTAGNIPLVYVFAALPVIKFRELLGKTFGRSAGWMFLLAALGLVGWVGHANLKAYFERGKTASLDPLPTELGLAAGRLPKGYQVALWSEGWGSSNPPVQLFSQKTLVRSFADPMEGMPFRQEPEEGGMMFALSEGYKPLISYLRQLYPGGEYHQIRSGQNDDVFFETLTVPLPELKKSWGLNARYLDGSGRVIWEGVDQALTGQALTLTAASAQWEGSLFLPTFASTSLYLQTPGDGEVWLDGRLTGQTRHGAVQSKPRPIAAGMHQLKVRWSGQGRPGMLFLAQTPLHTQIRYFSQDGPRSQPVTGTWTFHSLGVHGLMQRLYSGQTWTGEPVYRVDTVLKDHWLDNPLYPCSFLWDGRIQIGRAGFYAFHMHSNDYTDVRVAGQLVSKEGLAPADPKLDLSQPKPTVYLKPGSYPVEIHFSSHGGLNYDFEWSRTDQAGDPRPAFEMIPPEALSPGPSPS
jgi:hypothetical protein